MVLERILRNINQKVTYLWLYSLVKSKLDSNNVPVDTVSVEMQELVEQANRAYPTVRNILYQTLKTSAENIGELLEQS